MSKQNKKVVLENGKEYVIQNLPVREAVRIRQESRLPGHLTDDLRWYEQLLEHCVIDPSGLKIDDFTNVPELEELMGQVMGFVYGGK